MKKLIKQILRLDPAAAYHYKGMAMGFWWEYPFRHFVGCSETVIGSTGGPSEATIKDYSYSWKKTELRKASKRELMVLKEEVEKNIELQRKLHERYKSMSLYEFLNQF